MKYYIKLLMALLFLGPSVTYAQLYEARDSTVFSYGGDFHVGWGDMNGNSEFDILTSLKDDLGNIRMFMLGRQLNVIDSIQIDSLASTFFTMADMDNNNRLDLITEIKANGATYLSVILQSDSMTFDEPILLDSTYTQKLIVSDFDRNGLKDLMYFSGRDTDIKLTLCLQKVENWQKQDISIPDLTGFLLEGYDANLDGYTDLFLGGYDSTSHFRSHILFYNNGVFKSIDSTLFDFGLSTVAISDMDWDGRSDILGYGLDSANNSRLELFLANGERVQLDTPDNKIQDAYLADYNSDGRSDIVVTTKNKNSSILLNVDSAHFVLEKLSGLVTKQSFADMDFDGDLDRLRVRTEGDSLYMIIEKNTTVAENDGPLAPAVHTAFVIKGNVKVVWDPSLDDHTSAKSLTYDVFIGRSNFSTELLASNFNTSTTKRFLASHGNSGYKNEMLLNGLSAGDYFYGIQSLDNAYHYQIDGGSSNECGDRAIACGSFNVCDEEPASELITVCAPEITLFSQENTAWYSMAKGFLGFHQNLDYALITDRDTLYAKPVNLMDCRKNRLIILQKDSVGSVNLPDQQVCLGEEVDINLPIVPDSAAWYSTNHGAISQTHHLKYRPLASDTIYIEGSVGGCIFRDTIFVEAMRLELDINGTNFTIIKGESVQLNASGGSTYLWSPTEGLNSVTSSDPTASPITTTTYTLEGIDSLGCKDTLQVVIEVLENGFLPDLFTPNEDNINDKLKVYGLRNTLNFEFTIYNRSGVLVYSTTNVIEVTSNGWDGLHNNKFQPSGAYFWKVSGQNNDGSNIQLNGKTSGVIYLMR